MVISWLRAPLEADDTVAAREALRLFGVEVADSSDSWRVRGSGGWLRAPAIPVDVGASGLTARSVIAVASLVDGTTTVVGRDRLPERPMGGLVDALDALGVEVMSVDGHLPVTIHGAGALPGGSVSVDSRQTSQFASALLLTAPLAQGGLTVIPQGLEGSQRYLQVTIGMMEDFGAVVDRLGVAYRVEPHGYTSTDIVIEPDASAAVYPMVAAAITGGRVTIEGLGSESVQPDLGIAVVLERMGCEVRRRAKDTTVVAPIDGLQPIDIDLSGSPDGSLAVAVAALFADGPSRLRGLGSLRHKESDRLAALATEITRLGAGAPDRGGCSSDHARRPPPRPGADLRGSPVGDVVCFRRASDPWSGDRRPRGGGQDVAILLGTCSRPSPNRLREETARQVVAALGCDPRRGPTRSPSPHCPNTPIRTPSGIGSLSARRICSPPVTDLIVTLDGPAGTGKSTVSKEVASRLGLPRLDTGAFYRAAGLAALRAGVDLADHEAVANVVAGISLDQQDGRMLLDGLDVSEEIRSQAATEASSMVSTHPEVRGLLVVYQRVGGPA